MASLGTTLVMVGGSGSATIATTGVLTLGPARPPASPSGPPPKFALKVQVGNTPMIVDVTKAFTLGPLAVSKDHFELFATGPTGTSIFGSSNGALWAQEINPSGLTAGGVTGRPVVLQAISDGQGGVLAVGKVTNTSGDNGMIWHMTKPGKWAQVQFQDDPPPEFSSIVAGPAGFVASSDKAGGSPIMYSSDGDTWQAASIAVGGDFSLSVATYRYGYVAVGSDLTHLGATTAWTSPDGQTWTLRTDWHLPANVTALFGVGNTMVASATTAATATPSGSASASGSAKPAATPTPAASPAAATTTWWYSPTGVVWQKSGLQTNARNWANVNSQILVLDPPTTAAGNWTIWTTPDGMSWQHLTTASISFTGAKTCDMAATGSQIVIVGWDPVGSLKDYLGSFASQ